MTDFPIYEPKKSILALDVASVLGYAHLCDKSSINSGYFSFKPRPGMRPGDRFMRFQGWVNASLHNYRPSFVAYELVLQPHKSRNAAAVYHGMISILLAECERRGIEYKGFTVQQVKRAATGKGSAKKEVMIEAAKRQFPCQKIVDDNQADALWILYCACEHLNIPLDKPQKELF